MKMIRNAAFAAATLAIAVGASAATSNADAGWRLNIGSSHGIYFNVHRHSCWQPVWNGWGYETRWVCRHYGH